MTNTELASELGVGVRTLERYFERGLARPKDGEAIADWGKRSRRWRRLNRKPPGPRAKRAEAGELGGDALERQRRLRAELLEIQLAERRGEIHSTKECEAQAIRRLQELRNALGMLPDQLARALYQAPSPDAIKVRVEEAIRRVLEALSRE